MKKILLRYLLVALSFFMLPMQGSLIQHDYQYDDLVDQISPYPFKQNYDSLATILDTFNKKSLDFSQVYSHNKVIIDDDNIYDTVLEDIVDKLDDNVFDLNILQLLFHYGAKLEDLYIILSKKEKNFVTKIFKITRERNGMQANVNYGSVKLIQFFTNACCSKSYANYYMPESAIRNIVPSINLEIDIEKEAEKIGGNIPVSVTNLVFSMQQATALVFILNGFNVYNSEAIKDHFSEKNIAINTDLLPLMAEKVIKNYIRKHITSSSSFWAKDVFWNMIYQSILHTEIYSKLIEIKNLQKNKFSSKLGLSIV